MFYCVELLHIQPGTPTQNAYTERVNRTHRTEVLDCHVFTRLDEVGCTTDDWRYRYNPPRPHRARGGLPTAAYAIASSVSSSSQ
ncbi:MAG: transposase [Rhizorhabdus sp.]